MRWPILLLILLGASACAPSIKPTNSDYCRIYEPLRYNPAIDRKFVTDQIDRENGKYECACNKDCPKVSP